MSRLSIVGERTSAVIRAKEAQERQMDRGNIVRALGYRTGVMPATVYLPRPVVRWTEKGRFWSFGG